MPMFRNIIIGFILLILVGCYPDSSISPAESDTVYTYRRPDVDFADYKTYHLIDSILRIDDYIDLNNTEGPYDQLILQRVEENFNARGYVKLIGDNAENASVNIYVSDLSAINIVQYWNYIPYWIFTNDAYVQGTAYFPVSLPSSTLIVPESNIIIDMIPNDFVTIPEDTLKVYWRGVTKGIYDINMQDRLIRNIDQMFFQSPYLKPVEK